MRFLPMTWAAIHVALATASTYLLCVSDVLSGATTAAFLIH